MHSKTCFGAECACAGVTVKNVRRSGVHLTFGAGRSLILEELWRLSAATCTINVAKIRGNPTNADGAANPKGLKIRAIILGLPGDARSYLRVHHEGDVVLGGGEQSDGEPYITQDSTLTHLRRVLLLLMLSWY